MTIFQREKNEILLLKRNISGQNNQYIQKIIDKKYATTWEETVNSQTTTMHFPKTQNEILQRTAIYNTTSTGGDILTSLSHCLLLQPKKGYRPSFQTTRLLKLTRLRSFHRWRHIQVVFPQNHRRIRTFHVRVPVHVLIVLLHITAQTHTFADEDTTTRQRSQVVVIVIVVVIVGVVLQLLLLLMQVKVLQRLRMHRVRRVMWRLVDGCHNRSATDVTTGGIDATAGIISVRSQCMCRG